MTKQYVVVGLGEILWDMFPGGKQLGGAPANFAYHAHALGDRGTIVSRTGADRLGEQTLNRLKDLGLCASWIQRDPVHATGTVEVTVDDKGEPDFTIVGDVAWDYLEWERCLMELVPRVDAVCFGSLAQRSRASRDTIRAFLASVRRDCVTIFDVNLRQTFFSAEIVEESLKISRIVKLNHEELPRLVDMFSLSGGGEEETSRRLLDRFGLQLVCITRGDRGSLIVSESQMVAHPGYRVTVKDTVGSGDAFTAAMCYHYLRGSSLERISDAANRLGSWVATQPGATPDLKHTLLDQIRDVS